MELIVKIREGVQDSYELIFQSDNRFQAVNIKRKINKVELVRLLHNLADNIQHDDLFY